MDSVFVSGVSCNKELAADSVRGFAVKAFSGRFTWGLNIESLGIGRCSNISGTFHGTVKVAADLVYSHNEDHFFRALGNTGNAVGVAINIY